MSLYLDNVRRDLTKGKGHGRTVVVVEFIPIRRRRRLVAGKVPQRVEAVTLGDWSRRAKRPASSSSARLNYRQAAYAARLAAYERGGR